MESISGRADYWKSQGRKFCDFCKCWIADNKPSIDFHEGGKKHKENVSKRLKEIHKNSAKQAKQNKKFEDDLRKMENAAMAAYLKDVENDTRDMTAERLIKEKMSKIEPTKKIPGYVDIDVDPCDPLARPSKCTAPVPPRAKNLRLNGECRQQGNKGKAEKNKGKPTKGKRVNREDDRPGQPTRKVWYEAVSPEGYTYYWHTENNESVWEAPEEGYMTLAEQEEEATERAIQERLYEQLEEEEERGKHEILEEQRANVERERMRQLRVVSRGKEEEEEAVDAVYRRDYSVPEEPRLPARTGWQVVRTVDRTTTDLQLPSAAQSTSVPVVIAPFEVTEPAPPTQRVFKEKTIAQLITDDDDDDNEAESSTTIAFKKRKISSRNVRKRMTDDD